MTTEKWSPVDHFSVVLSGVDFDEIDTALLQVGIDGVAATDLESQTLDFKAWSGKFGEIAAIISDALVCLVNADGGHVVVGVRDRERDRAAALAGVPASVDSEAMRRAVYERTRPAVTPFVSERIVDGARLLVLTVPAGVQPHSNAAGSLRGGRGGSACPFRPANSVSGSAQDQVSLGKGAGTRSRGLCHDRS